jgi:hypothetical protein
VGVFTSVIIEVEGSDLDGLHVLVVVGKVPTFPSLLIHPEVDGVTDHGSVACLSGDLAHGNGTRFPCRGVKNRLCQPVCQSWSGFVGKFAERVAASHWRDRQAGFSSVPSARSAVNGSHENWGDRRGSNPRHPDPFCWPAECSNRRDETSSNLRRPTRTSPGGLIRL